jgi:hypothetical protein
MQKTVFLFVGFGVILGRPLMDDGRSDKLFHSVRTNGIPRGPRTLLLYYNNGDLRRIKRFCFGEVLPMTYP